MNMNIASIRCRKSGEPSFTASGFPGASILAIAQTLVAGGYDSMTIITGVAPEWTWHRNGAPKTIAILYLSSATSYTPAKERIAILVRETATKVVCKMGEDGPEMELSKVTGRVVGAIRGTHAWYYGFQLKAETLVKK